ncbi:D-alanyl-D-alanine carboxypeptidase/D-alanyl-D-alanine-endopeptidase [Streptomyces sp. 7-21]|uniref:D-alanyl-D-alanine carboxypeptidase/D-alanyl-D-alanine endopeptidase n=1 Tax=Streptomyces sp. 7-21 TaxID=2802283 RepID=UPI0027DDFCF0|nr:D-alanyl-D-alanine carboxypeptidase/D-alanyl-D-alanine-endopeptidase [Streptomyces sp. 7-21]
MDALRALARRTRTSHPVVRLATVAAAAGLALTAGIVAAAGPWDGGQRAAERDRAADATPGAGAAGFAEEEVAGAATAARVLAPLEAEGAAPAPAALRRALGAPLADPALGPGGAAAAVVDVATGETVFSQDARTGMAPASTVKIVTAAAALHTLGGGHRLTTTAVWDAGAGRVTLIGGGDPTLTDDDLARLAERTADALAEEGVESVRVGYDDSLYPTQRHPIGVNENIALITPLQVNAGRLDDSSHGPAPRAGDPAPAAAERFAAHLADAGLRVRGGEPGHGAAPEDAVPLARHHSATVSVLVERMLTHSDNDLAEALSRHTALATGHRADFRGAARAATGVLEELGLPLAGVSLADGSGLDRDGRVTAALLANLLTAAASPDRPELRPALTGLPVAGFTGTLSSRYSADDGGAGLVRAKTGTLTGVNSLAGTAVTPGGRLLAFAFLAGDTTDPAGAEAALDAAATALATCACR